MEQRQEVEGALVEIPLQEEPKPKKENQPKQFQNSWICSITIYLSIASVMLSTGINGGSFNAIYGTLIVFFNSTHQMRNNGSNISQDDMTYLFSLSGSMMFLGGFFGTILSGFVLSKLGRKYSIIGMNLINLVATILMAVVPFVLYSPEVYIVGRFLFGFFSGFGMNLIPMLVHELSVPQKSPFQLSLIGVMISAGGLFGLCMGFNNVLGDYDLRYYLISLSGLPSLVYLLLAKWLPDSPYTLIRDRRRQDAVSSMKRLHDDMNDAEIDDALNKIETRLQMESETTAATFCEMFKVSGNRRIMLTILCVFTQVQLCGYVGVAMYTRMIFESADFTPYESITATAIVLAVQFAVALVGSYFVDRYGPKRLNYCSSYCMAFSLTLLTVSMHLAETMETFKFISVAAVALYMLSYSGGVSLTMFPMLISYSTEHTRSTSLAIGGGVFWILAWLVGFTFPYLLETMHYLCHVPSIVLNILFGLIVLVKMPETQGREPEEITNLIQGVKKARDESEEQNNLSSHV